MSPTPKFDELFSEIDQSLTATGYFDRIPTAIKSSSQMVVPAYSFTKLKELFNKSRKIDADFNELGSFLYDEALPKLRQLEKISETPENRDVLARF